MEMGRKFLYISWDGRRKKNKTEKEEKKDGVFIHWSRVSQDFL